MMRTGVVALIVLLAASSVFAQCKTSDSAVDCWHRFVPEIPPPPDPNEVSAAQSQAEAGTKKAIGQSNTGLTSLLSSSSSALTDFLSILSASMQSSSLTSNGTAMTFDWNPRVGKDQPIKVEAVFAEAKLSSAVTGALGANAAGLSTLRDSLTNTDDVTASVSYSPVNTSFGRSIVPHRSYFDSLIKATLARATSAQADDAMIKALQAAGVKTATFGKPVKEIEKIKDKPDEQQALLNKIEASAKAQKQLVGFDDKLTRSFAKLLNNQPQPFVSLLYHERKDIVGPSETILKATYEYGFVNLNSFFKDHRAECDPQILAKGDVDPAADLAHKSGCIDSLETYAGSTGPDESSDDKRVAFSVEYHDARAVHVDLPQYTVKYDVNSGRSLVGSLTGGWTVAPRSDLKSGRVDLSVSYENIRNAAVIPGTTGTPPADVKDRLIASITYTQKINDTISFPVALIYANHAAFLSNIDRKLNAHFGLQYKLPKM
jgi:hypothetical protein